VNPRFRTQLTVAEIKRAMREAAENGKLLSLTTYEYSDPDHYGQTAIVLCQLAYNQVEAHVVQRAEKAYGYGSLETKRWTRKYDSVEAFEATFHADRKDFADFTRETLPSLRLVAA